MSFLLCIIGKLRDATGSFLSLNILNGGCMIFGGLILFLYPLVKRLSPREEESTVAVVDVSQQMKDIGEDNS